MRALLLVSGLFLMFRPAGAQSWQDTLTVSSLGDVMDAIESSNPALLSARNRADLLSTMIDQVGDLPDPVVAVGIQPIPIVTARGAQRSQWQIRQDVPYPGKLRLRRDQAYWASAAGAAEIEMVRQHLIERAGHAFSTLLRLRRQTRLIDEFRSSLRDHEVVARRRYEVGTGSQQAILKAQLEHNALAGRLLELSRERNAALEELATLTNRPIRLSDELESLDGPPRALDQEDLLDEAHRQRPEWEVLRAQSREAQTREDLARLDAYPDLSVNITYFDIADGTLSPAANGRDALALGFSLRIPLRRDRVRAGVEESRLRVSEVGYREEALETRVTSEIGRLVFSAERLAEEIQLYETALVPQARASLAATLSAYTTGRTGFLDLLDSERTLFDLLWSLEIIRGELEQSLVSLTRAVGANQVPAAPSEQR